MVRSRKLEADVAKLKTGLHKPPASNRPTRRNTSRKGASDKKNEANRNKSENPDNAELQLKDIEHVLREHGVKIEDLKGFWDQISAELKDLPTKKPLVTALGAFLLGFLAGRLSRK